MSREDQDRDYLKSFEEDRRLIADSFFGAETGVIYSWMGKKVLSGPRNQGDCHCCVACVVCDNMAAVLAGATEDIADRVLQFFSPQHICDCMHNTSSEPDTVGCRLSFFRGVYKFIESFGVLEESAYKFVARREKCGDPSVPQESLSDKNQKRNQKGILKKNKSKLLEKNMPTLPDRREPSVSNDSKRAFTSGFDSYPVDDYNEMIKIIRERPVGATIEYIRGTFNIFMGKSIYIPGDKPKPKPSITHKNKQKMASKSEVDEAETLISHAVLIIGYGRDPVTNRKFYLINPGAKIGDTKGTRK